jgi:predicted PurR-regulated permease PerM
VLVELVRYTALFFCSSLAAVALAAVAERLRFRERLPHALALALTLALLVMISGGLAWWIGPQLVPQFEELATQVPRGLGEARRWFESSPVGQRMSTELPDLGEAAPSPETMVQSTGQFVGAGFSALADFLILVIVAVFLAASPQRYAGGAVKLLPSRHRSRGAEVLAAMGGALRRWLLARAALMLFVTLLMGTGLLLLGVPLALPLAILAGLFSFVPYVGPALAVIPALAVGLLKSPMHALYVAALYLGVQMLESYVVEPIVEARAISLPPAMIIGAQVISAVWLGSIGVLVATPLLVVVVVAVQILYQRDVLGDDVDVIGS